ncbi:hypothetical protein ABZP36_014910 [Zizania latifolia]
MNHSAGVITLIVVLAVALLVTCLLYNCVWGRKDDDAVDEQTPATAQNEMNPTDERTDAGHTQDATTTGLRIEKDGKNDDAQAGPSETKGKNVLKDGGHISASSTSSELDIV